MIGNNAIFYEYITKLRAASEVGAVTEFFFAEKVCFVITKGHYADHSPVS